MKLFYDMFPIIIFFIAYKLYGIYTATLVAILAIAGQLLFSVIRGKKPEMIQVATLVLMIVLGGATLLFKNEIFIKWKPTAVYWLMGTVFLGSHFIGKKLIVQYMLEKNLELQSKAWTYLNGSWVAFFYIMGLLNLFVVYNFDTDTWVNFKLFGTLGLTAIFVIAQALALAKAIPAQDK